MNIIDVRLASHKLTTQKSHDVTDVVKWLGAVQAQEYADAKWSLANRLDAPTTDSAIENALSDGKILRTHVLRPTWHFVHPDDLSWMLWLTAPRVRQALRSYDRKLEIDEQLLTKTHKIILRTLGEHGGVATRQEFKAALTAEGVITDTQRLAHLVMYAELDQLICSGPRRGKQFTYARFENRAPKVAQPDRQEACAKLALRYFTSHGPAQDKDFAWWSGLTLTDTRQAIATLGNQLSCYEAGGKSYYFAPSAPQTPTKHSAFLVSIFDEYTIAYNDLSDMCTDRNVEKVLSLGNAFTAVILLDGMVAGSWKRKFGAKQVHITVTPFRAFRAQEKTTVQAEAHKYAAFFGLTATINGL